MARGTTIELSHPEYAVSWEQLGLGLRHWNLDLPADDTSIVEAEHVARVQGVLDGLRQRGLHDGARPALVLHECFHQLACAPREINGWVPTPQGRVRIVAVSRGETGLLARLDGERLVLQTGSSHQLTRAVTGLIEAWPAGEGTSVSVPSELLNARPPGGRTGYLAAELEAHLARNGVRAEDARSFATMVRGAGRAAAKFGAARRGRDGRRRTAGFTVTYLTTERGGYTLTERRGPDRRAWTTLAPADSAQQLGQRIDELVARIPEDAAQRR